VGIGGREATYSLSLIENYLEECSQLTRYALEAVRDYIQTDMKSSELFDCPPIEILQYQLNWHIKSFLLKIAIMTKDLIDWRTFREDKFQCTANDRIETFILLSGDKKFMKALEEIERPFREGYGKLIELKNKK
jgi:hypothetical protein